MPKVRMPDGSFIDVGADALFADDGSTTLTIPTGPVFTAEDLERVRSEEKNKLYGRIEDLNTNIATLTEQVGGLTAEQQREKAAAVEEKARLEEEARRQEEEGLDAQTLLARAREEWNQTFAAKEQEWNTRLEDVESKRLQAEAVAAKEREFNDLKDYAQAQVEANKDKIAPEFFPWINGNTREEIDAAISRAVESTDSILAQFQSAQQVLQIDPTTGQPVPVVPQPPATPGTRVTGPVGEDPGAQFQTLTQQQIADMPMDQYARLRGTLGIGGQGNNRGMFG